MIPVNKVILVSYDFYSMKQKTSCVKMWRRWCRFLYHI